MNDEIIEVIEKELLKINRTVESLKGMLVQLKQPAPTKPKRNELNRRKARLLTKF